MSVEALLAFLPEGAKKHLDPTSPVPMRMMAAKGMVPLPPRDMVVVLCGHVLGDDEKIGPVARGTLAGLPNRLLIPAVEAGLLAEAFEILIEVVHCLDDAQDRHAFYEKLALVRDTPDAALATLATWAPEGVAEIIAANQERCLRSEAIVEALRHNGNILKSSLDRLFDFLVRSGVIHGDMPEYGEAMARLTPQEAAEVADNIELPPEAQRLVENSIDSEERAGEAAHALEQHKAEPEEVARRVPMLKLVNSLNVSQKIALALKGNKEARTILIRENNRLVATAVINSPRITEQEIIAAAQSKSVSDEVIRTIARSKDLSRPYMVKKALVMNPKTPLVVTTRLMTLLRTAELKTIAKSRSVPSAVAAQAKRLLLRKK